MKVECVPLTSFVHGDINAHEGKPTMIEKRLADELEKNGLIRVKRPKVTPADVRLAQTDAGKAQDDGEGQPSSVSPAAPASEPMTTETLPLSAAGKRRGRPPKQRS